MASENKYEKYAYLNRLSTEQLQELLHADIESSEQGDTDVIFHILEVIESRERDVPSGILPDEDVAWTEFLEYYNIPEGDGLSLYPCSEDAVDKSTTTNIALPRRWIRGCLIIAATVAVLIVSMISAQATGIDVFGALARWTSEVFQFVPSSGDVVQEEAEASSDPAYQRYQHDMQVFLIECGIAEQLVPTWFPGGYKSDGPEVTHDDTGDTVYCLFNDGLGNAFSIQIMRYNSDAGIASQSYEKDSSNVNRYSSGGRTFYIVSNMDNLSGIWCDGATLAVNIQGNVKEQDMKKIIDSIGE